MNRASGSSFTARGLRYAGPVRDGWDRIGRRESEEALENQAAAYWAQPGDE